MIDPTPVDALEVLVLVDNVTDSLSTNPPGVEAEWRGLLARGRIRLLAGANICCAHHGLSLLITARIGARTETLLFDAGPEGATFLRNAAILGVDFAAIGNVVLSHGHWDHAGGLPAALTQIAGARAASVNCYVHPGMFAQRGTRLPSGIVFPMEAVAAPEELAMAGAAVVNTREPQVTGEGAFYVSGEIPRNTAYESGLPGHVRRSEDGADWLPDPLLMDERFVSVHIRGKGQFIFSACSHAGIVNVLSHARSLFGSVPIYGVMGGLHLSGSTEPIIPQTVADLRQFMPALIAPGHCTGWRALSAIVGAFGDNVVPLAVGKRFRVEGGEPT
jgi:7,8-dihydropterin-6-yl-methyl-4-(beta-D-ribofuranosyl)aminobenzene 5'-phosphate synthase